jgi:hypothetical protein
LVIKKIFIVKKNQNEKEKIHLFLACDETFFSISAVARRDRGFS